VSHSNSRRKKETVADMQAPTVSHREAEQGEEKGARRPAWRLVGRASGPGKEEARGGC